MKLFISLLNLFGYFFSPVFLQVSTYILFIDAVLSTHILDAYYMAHIWDIYTSTREKKIWVLVNSIINMKFNQSAVKCQCFYKFYKVTVFHHQHLALSYLQTITLIRQHT